MLCKQLYMYLHLLRFLSVCCNIKEVNFQILENVSRRF